MPSPTLSVTCFGAAGKISESLHLKSALGRNRPVTIGLGVIIVAKLATLGLCFDEEQQRDAFLLFGKIVHVQHDVSLCALEGERLKRDLDAVELLGLTGL